MVVKLTNDTIIPNCQGCRMEDSSEEILETLMDFHFADSGSVDDGPSAVGIPVFEEEVLELKLIILVYKKKNDR